MDAPTPKLPSLPSQVLKAASERRLVIFLGAGISCAVGLPDWNSVKEQLIKEMRPKPGDEPDIRAQLKRTSFYQCFENVFERDQTTYERVMSACLKSTAADLAKFRQLIISLNSLGPVSFVTTNVDDLLLDSGQFRRELFRLKEKCVAQEIPTGKVFCLHGDANSYVFKQADLDRLYSDRHFKNFLINLFGSYCVLFVGFSFRDESLKKHLLLSPYLDGKGSGFIQHFALLPHTQRDPAPFDLRTNYGIDLICFDNSDKHYTNFCPAILSWSGAVSLSPGGRP